MFSKKVFGDRIKALRIQHGLKQSELAEKVGLGRTSITLIENGERAASIEVAYALADCFDVTTDYLLGRTDEA